MANDSNYLQNRAKGWAAIFRSLQEHWLYPEDRPFTDLEAWIDLLLEANHKDRKVKINSTLIECKRGESIRSISQWGKRWKWGKSKVYRFLNLLKEDGMIETVNETVTTRIRICNYTAYQDMPSKNGTHSERNWNASETQADTNNNVNNDNNENTWGGLSDFSYLPKMEKPLSDDQYRKLVDRFGEDNVLQKLSNIDNYMKGGKTVDKCYVSVYDTALNWLKRDNEHKESQPQPAYLTTEL